jgi:hypothetical protein
MVTHDEYGKTGTTVGQTELVRKNWAHDKSWTLSKQPRIIELDTPESIMFLYSHRFGSANTYIC